MPLLDALQLATFTNAGVLGMEEEIGQLAPGFLADLVAVPKEALLDPALLMEVKYVMKDGKIVNLDK